MQRTTFKIRKEIMNLLGNGLLCFIISTNNISCVQNILFLNYNNFIHIVENLAVKEKYK